MTDAPTELARLTTALTASYAIEHELGRGGMATVYLARDIKHDRHVAVKVLHPDLAAALGAERFLTEIRTTANLQHPHILPLHDSGEAGGALFYVMPFIEGETLRARLERESPLPIDEAVRLAREVLSALDYAHRKGIIHRDVKPENVLLHDGSALVADFGIALAVQSAGGQRMTQTGLSLGTPSYMSPEQAMGERTVDARSDVYATGAMLYEMLTGEPPFTGPSVQAIVAKVMTERPTPPSTVRDTVPEGVEDAVLKALAKLPADRFGSAKEFADALMASAERPQTRSTHAVRPGARSRFTLLKTVLPWVVAAALGAALLVAVRRPVPSDRPIIRMRLDLPAGEQVMVNGFPLALSPAGDHIAYVTSGVQGYRTFVRRSDELVGHQIAPVSLSTLGFSRDGRWMAYAQGREIRKVAADGGAPTTLGSVTSAVYGISWANGSDIVVATAEGLWVMPSTGGTAHRVTDAHIKTSRPLVLADGRTVVYASDSARTEDGELTAVSLDGGAPARLGIQHAVPLGMVDGYLLYTSATGDLMASPFDARQRRVTGDPVRIQHGVTGGALSASGTLAYLPIESRSRLVLASRTHDDVSVLPDARGYNAPRFSPDGRRIAVAVRDSTNGFSGDIWVSDLASGTLTRLTTEGSNGVPEWSPDGNRILYRTIRGDDYSVRWQRADGGTPPELLYTPPMHANEAFLSPDGRLIVYRTAPETTAPRSIFAATLGAGTSPVLLVGGPAAHIMPRLSPNGRWLAYQSDESGRYEIYVRPFPGEGPRVQVSTEGGTQAMWSRNGGTLYYTAARGLVAAAVTQSPAFAVRERRTVLRGDYLDDVTHQNYDVSPDDQTFVMLQPEAGRGGVVIVHEWIRELRARLAMERR